MTESSTIDVDVEKYQVQTGMAYWVYANEAGVIVP